MGPRGEVKLFHKTAQKTLKTLSDGDGDMVMAIQLLSHPRHVHCFSKLGEAKVTFLSVPRQPNGCHKPSNIHKMHVLSNNKVSYMRH
jgi:hypothetical protein